MAKTQIVYFCKECGNDAPKWQGKCNFCHAWNSITEKRLTKEEQVIQESVSLKTITLNDVELSTEKKRSTGIKEVDRVLGGGLVDGSLILLGGDPGIGKSTLALQIANKLSAQSTVLYTSGEESVKQIAMRAKRLDASTSSLHLISSTSLEDVLKTATDLSPDVLILDSVQTISSKEVPSSAGSVSQVKTCTEGLMKFAKSTGVTTIIIGHVTKEGSLAGPRTLEHLVDTVLYLEGDRFQELRILRSVKHRFGACGEVGIFAMQEEGLMPLKDPGKEFLTTETDTFGVAKTVIIEGSRPFLIEIQALVNKSSFGFPKRTASGFDINRLNLLAAVISKYTPIQLEDQDIFINIVGGLKTRERAVDLAVCLAIVSSYRKKALQPNAIVLGEVGLTGEVRPVSKQKKRLKEAEQLGFKKCIGLSKHISEVINAI